MGESQANETVRAPRRRGRPVVDRPLSHVHTRLPPDLHDSLCRVAQRHGISVSTACRVLIIRALRSTVES